ncbi:MAG: HAD family phosphatase, partial [Trueperaceae bacterium]
FDAVLFDMDGTLIDTEPAWFEAERVTAARHGVHLPDSAYAELHGLDADGMTTVLRERYGLSVPPAVFLADLAERLHDALAQARPRPGAEALVRSVAGAGVARAVVSNSPRVAVEATLAPHRWAGELLPLRISVDDVARGKPAPDAYLAAAERLRLPPSACLAIEDSVAGATAAVRAGATCVFVTNEGEVDDAVAATITPYRVASLTHLGRNSARH